MKSLSRGPFVALVLMFFYLLTLTVFEYGSGLFALNPLFCYSKLALILVFGGLLLVRQTKPLDIWMQVLSSVLILLICLQGQMARNYYHLIWAQYILIFAYVFNSRAKTFYGLLLVGLTSFVLFFALVPENILTAESHRVHFGEGVILLTGFFCLAAIGYRFVTWRRIKNKKTQWQLVSIGRLSAGFVHDFKGVLATNRLLVTALQQQVDPINAQQIQDLVLQLDDLEKKIVQLNRQLSA